MTAAPPSPLERARDLVPEWWWRSYPWEVWLRLVEVRFLDRALVIAAQAFVALLPLVIIASSLLASDDSRAVANAMVDRFGLAGAAVASVRLLFAVPGDSQSTVNLLGVVVVLFTAVSLSRRVRATYAAAYQLTPDRGRLTGGLVWVLLQVATLIVAGWLRGFVGDPWTSVVVIVVLVAVWFASILAGSSVLLSGQVSRRDLLPTAVATTIGLVGVSIYASVWLPRVIERQAESFGPIGVAFSLFSWLLSLSVAIVVGAVLGAVFTERRTAREGDPAETAG